MTKFNPEEVNLCKQVAEKYRKEIVRGDWIINSMNKRFLVSGVELWKSQRPGLEHTIAYDLDPVDRLEDAIVTLDEQIKEYIPLWTISDCLEFLVEKGWSEITIEVSPVYYNNVKCFAEKGEVDKGCECGVMGEGKTPLEACLKAVLAVVEETA